MILLLFLMVYPLSLVTAMYLVKSLKEMPVHFSAGSTPDTYAHITTAAQKEAAKAMGKSQQMPSEKSARPGCGDAASGHRFCPV